MKFIFSKILLLTLLASCWPNNRLAAGCRVNEGVPEVAQVPATTEADPEAIDSQLVVVRRSQQLRQQISPSDVCGGILVSSTIVITAAHCFHDPQRFPHRFRVTHGGAGNVRANWLVAHPDYMENGRHNDIGALRLERAVCERCLLPAVGQSIPMALWTNDDAKLEMMVFLIENNHIGTKRLPVRWTANHTCQAAYHRWGIHISPRQICVDSLDPQFSHRGESAVLLVNGQPIGVLSFKLDLSSAANSPPYIHTDLTRYPDFVARQIRSDAAYRICSSILYVVISLAIVE